MRKNTTGFTIVELAIVVAVIGILAAVSYVAYNGIQKHSTEASMKSDLQGAAKLLAIDIARNNKYPASTTEADRGNGLKSSPGNSFQYTASANDYCLTVFSSKSGMPAYKISSTDTSPVEGVCSGHTAPSTGGGTQIANNAPIQSVTSAQCAALPVFTGSNSDAVRTVTDARGGTTRTYEIAKLADNKCWMLANLKLGGTSSITLTPSDSDVASNLTLPALVTTGDNEYDSPRVYGPVPGDNPSKPAANHGYMYNFSAATAGETRTSLPAGNGNAAHSICPANWRLPTGRVGSSGGDFAQLDIAFGGNGNYHQFSSPSAPRWQPTGAFKATFGGRWYNVGGVSGFASVGDGSLWSSSAFSDASEKAFRAYVSPGYFDPGYVNPGGADTDRYVGFGVRCLLR